MRIRVEHLKEPDLVFTNGRVGWEPKSELAKPDMGSSPPIEHVDLGLVAPVSEVEAVRRWVSRMHRLIISGETNAKRFREFPGVEKVFRCNFHLPDRFIRTIEDSELARASVLPAREGFDALLELYGGRVLSLFGDVRPRCVLVCFPESLATLRVSNPRLSERERAALERLQREDDDEQLALFAPSPEDLRLASELRPQAEELLFRSFYRALKARCMNYPNPEPLQVIRRHTYIPEEATQSDATRAWNLALSVYYKSGHIPWRPNDLHRDTCFVGVSFHHLKRRSGDVVYASLAQTYASGVEPFALQGGVVPRNQTRERQPYLTEEQAEDLSRRVVATYAMRAGARPSRVVIHKTSRYQPEERAGFEGALLSEVPACELVSISQTGFRLLRRGMQEPWRGTLCTLGEQEHYLFTTGYVPQWEEYPGPHIPAPLKVSSTSGDVRESAREILALTKMNWNSAEGIGRHPITVSFARKVGTIMTEVPEDSAPNPLYRFYM